MIQNEGRKIETHRNPFGLKFGTLESSRLKLILLLASFKIYIPPPPPQTSKRANQNLTRLAPNLVPRLYLFCIGKGEER